VLAVIVTIMTITWRSIGSVTITARSKCTAYSYCENKGRYICNASNYCDNNDNNGEVYM
jgi:hypothetical protein